MVIGAMAYFARYAIFGTVSLPLELIIVSQALHGVCYSCFFAAELMFVDRLAVADLKHSAQTLFGIIILGGGPVLAGYLLGVLERMFTRPGGQLDYSELWYTLSAIGLLAALTIAVMFRDEVARERAAGPGRIT